MEYEEIKRLIEIGEPVDGDLSLNNYSVGTISFFPHKLYEALEKLPDDGEVKILADEDEIELYLEKFRNVPPDEFEFEFSKAALIKNDKAYSEFTDEQITEVVIGMFKQADKKVLLRRLLERDVRITFEVMMLNFDYMISSLFLRFLSIAQMRAANEIRKEIDLPPLSKKQMKRYIDEPLQEGENILLDTGRGANPQTKAEIEKERQIFLKNIFFAFKELDKKRITVPKQKDLRPYIFKPYKDVEQKISETLRKHKLRFKDLWRIYLLNKSLESFLSAVNTTK